MEDRSISRYFFSEENFVFLKQLVQQTIWRRFRVKIRREVNEKLLDAMKVTFDLRPAYTAQINKNDYILLLNKKVLSETLGYAAQSAINEINEKEARRDPVSKPDDPYSASDDLTPRPQTMIKSETVAGVDSSYETLLRERANLPQNSEGHRAQVSGNSQVLKATGLRDEFVIAKPDDVATGIPPEILDKSNNTLQLFEKEEMRRRRELALTRAENLEAAEDVAPQKHKQLRAISVLPSIAETDENQSDFSKESTPKAVNPAADPQEMFLTVSDDALSGYLDISRDPAYIEYRDDILDEKSQTTKDVPSSSVAVNEIMSTPSAPTKPAGSLDDQLKSILASREADLLRPVVNTAIPAAQTVLPGNNEAGWTESALVASPVVSAPVASKTDEVMSMMALQVTSVASILERVVKRVDEIASAERTPEAVRENSQAQHKLHMCSSAFRDVNKYPTVSLFEITCVEKSSRAVKLFVPAFSGGLPVVKLTIGSTECLCEVTPLSRDVVSVSANMPLCKGPNTLKLCDFFGEPLYCQSDVIDLISINANNLRIICGVSQFHGMLSGDKILFRGVRSQNESLQDFLNRESGHRVFVNDSTHFEIDSGGFTENVNLTHFGQVVQTKLQVYVLCQSDKPT